MNVRNIVFSAVLCLFLCGPIVLFCSEKTAGLQLPAWATAEEAKYLEGESKFLDMSRVLSVEAFEDGAFQSALEDEVGCHIPLKAHALLGCARVQHGAICFSNLLFDWSCTPFFYGSSIVLTREGDRLLETPEYATSEILEECSLVSKAYDSFAVRHPDVDVYLYLCPDSQNVMGGPVAQLVSDPMNYDTLRRVVLGETSSCIWVDGEVPYDGFCEWWFLSDHHWTINGAYDAYRRITRAMDIEHPVEKGDAIIYKQPKFYGSLARRALSKSVVDKIEDYCFDLPSFEIAIDGEEKMYEDLVHIDLYSNQRWKESVFSSRYAEYFHADHAIIRIDNRELPSGGSLLIVGDSYTNCFERLLATHYATTYVLDPRHLDATVDEFMKEHPEIEDVLFLMRATNFFSERTCNFLM